MKLLLEHTVERLKYARLFLYGMPEENTYQLPNTLDLELNSTLKDDPNRVKVALAVATKFKIQVLNGKVLITDIQLEIRRTGWGQIMVFLDDQNEVLVETHVKGYEMGILGYDSKTYQPIPTLCPGPYLEKYGTVETHFDISFN